jgi:hypothetical protein
MEGECLVGGCPTEEDECKTDPECSESPYQEPEASDKSGAIAGFSRAWYRLARRGPVCARLHAMRSTQQERRYYKTKFARRIADTIDLRASIHQLTPEALGGEFKKIDS